MTGEVGVIYTLHFDQRIGRDGRNGAQHYTGWARNVEARVAHHMRGTSGVPIINHVVSQGIGMTLADVRPGTRGDERRLKSAGHPERHCDVCSPKPEAKP